VLLQVVSTAARDLVALAELDGSQRRRLPRWWHLPTITRGPGGNAYDADFLTRVCGPRKRAQCLCFAGPQPFMENGARRCTGRRRPPNDSLGEESFDFSAPPPEASWRG